MGRWTIISKKKKKSQLKTKVEAEKRKTRGRTALVGIIITIGFLAVIAKLTYIIFVKGNEYKQAAYNQQTKSQIIGSNRGTIFDANGEILAVSVSVDTVSINPGKVKYTSGKVVENELLAQKFSEIFELDYDETLQKIDTNSSVAVIARKVEADKVNQLKTWMEEENITSGINIDEDYKRYYPNRNISINFNWILRNR